MNNAKQKPVRNIRDKGREQKAEPPEEGGQQGSNTRKTYEIGRISCKSHSLKLRSAPSTHPSTNHWKV